MASLWPPGMGRSELAGAAAGGQRPLKVSLFLTDEKGHLAGQIDDSLAGDLYLFEETWQPGQIGNTYHILPTLPGIPPGRYKLYAAVYESQTKKRLPAAGAGSPGLPRPCWDRLK